MSNKVILVGGFLEVIELCQDCEREIIGIIDEIDNPYFYSYKVLGKDKDASILWDSFKDIPLIIVPDSPQVRKKLREEYQSFGFSFDSIISKSARISSSAHIGVGTIIQNDVNLSSEASVGSFVKLNIRCNLMHNVIVKDYVTVAPNAVVLGNVKINEGVYIGANSTILPNISIAKNVIVGAGAVLTKDITQENSVYAGVPARRIR
jgi:sugar O-acyltransferase (sialic acid O-acetyltransferase NeuD family)